MSWLRNAFGDIGAKMRVWLCDLTYTQQTIASDVMPAAVGCIATYLAKYLEGDVDTRVFKMPEILIAALENDTAPDVIGFSNYIWNRDLSAEIARVIKSKHPDVVTVMGGPNYPTTLLEQEAFVRDHPMFDFYVVKEGEIAFAKLVQSLCDNEFDPARVPLDLPSLHRVLPDGSFHASETEERIRDMNEIPSPYLTGLMDEFFDGKMLPIIQTNRGCPFRCTFCVEGMSYYSKVAKGGASKTRDEIHYIGERMAKLREHGFTRTDMFIADSNFGMYKEDMETCEAIAEIQEKYAFPEYINVATGKNQKKRVLDAARMIGGSLRISGSVQSLDKSVLENIERANIDEQEILDLALSASEVGANSYSEIILALPGDTRDAHLKTIQTIIEADFNTVALFQLMLLPGTDLASEESVQKWGMETQYRVLPRCYGSYELFGETIHAAEIERICVGNNSLSRQDYLDCRHFHLVVNLFYNDAVYKEVLRLIRQLGLSKYEWMKRVWSYRENANFNALVEQFLNETREELWDDEDELRAFTRDGNTIEKLVQGELGANLIFKYKTLGLVKHPRDLADVAKDTLATYLTENGADQDSIDLGMELIEFARLRMSGLFNESKNVYHGGFNYDVPLYSSTPVVGPAKQYRFDKSVEYSFRMSPDQQDTIENFKGIYGDSVIGLGRILSKVYVRKLYRHAEPVGGGEGHASDDLNNRELAIKEAQLSGLNEFT